MSGAVGGRLEGRAALVTGGADGIGLGIACRLGGEGAAVLVVDYDDEKGEAAAATLRAMGARADFQHCDVSQRDEVKAAVAVCIERFGAIDVLVNNAYRGRGPGRIEAKSDNDFLDAMTVCLMAAKWSMEAAFPAMRARGWGRIVNVASLNGVNAHIGTAEYNAGKEALRAYTRTAAREWASYGICANIICPAAISSNFRRFQEMQPELAASASAANPMGRMGDPEADIGGVALFLASEDARYVTGNTLFVDGGAHINGVAWVPHLGPED